MATEPTPAVVIPPDPETALGLTARDVELTRLGRETWAAYIDGDIIGIRRQRYYGNGVYLWSLYDLDETETGDHVITRHLGADTLRGSTPTKRLALTALHILRELIRLEAMSND